MAALRASREFDVVVFGATGFTGRKVARHLAKYAPQTRVALAGRSEDKLRAITEELPGNVGVIVADVFDDDQVADMASRTKCVASLAGPYAQLGLPIVRACVDNETDYCDLTGEAHFIRASADKFHAEAKAKGTRIVHCCGYDSVPSDIGALLCVNALDGDVAKIDYHAGKAKGGVSGGTIASAFGVLELPSNEIKALADPYYIADADGRGSGDSSELWGVRRTGMGMWAGPFVMAGINERVVRRSASLLKWPKSLRYHEHQLTGRGIKGLLGAIALTFSTAIGIAALAIPPLRKCIRNRFLPKQGEGPSEELCQNGHFVSTLLGESTDGHRRVKVTVKGKLDPGYAGTAVMIGEAAIALASSTPKPDAGGVLTPASALGTALSDRLNKEGTITFTVENK